MPALMLPIVKTYDPDQVDGLFSVHTKLARCIPVALLSPLADDGCGRATVDGRPLSRCEMITVRGIHLLMVPVGEVARAYGGRYRVALEGFTSRGGRRFPRCAFWIRTAPRREALPEFIEHDLQALAAAREGMVLLKNDNGALPLPEDAWLNCLGCGQHAFRVTATGASRINPRWQPDFHRAVGEHSRFRLNEALSDFYRDTAAGAPDAALLADAREKSDTALAFITRHSGEMIDNRPVAGEYYLTDAELDMLAAARRTFDRLVVILNTGYPISMRWMRDIAPDAVLYTGFAGMLASYALVELLDGRANPCGHLPDTWPWDFYDHPVSRNFPAIGADERRPREDEKGVRIYYEEDVYLGYRYFDTFGVPVAFPFGHGLGYAPFDLEPVGLRREGDAVAVRVAVTNRGHGVAGRAVAQLYASAPAGRLEKPAHVLVGFEKTRPLAPGETQVLALSARLEDMASFDAARGAWVLEAGEYALYAGQSLGELIPCGGLRLDERVLKTVEHIAAPVEPLRRLTRASGVVEGGQSRVVPLGEQIARPAARAAYRPQPLPEYRGARLRWRDVQADPDRLDDFVAQLSLWALCRLNVCGGARWMPWQDGVAGFTPPMPRRGLPPLAASDANAGLNLKRRNIGFPASSVIAATFDREMAYAVGRVIAEESPAHGVCQNLGPGMNLHRSLLCGRHPEYFSEDPLLTGELAGWHGRGLSEHGVGCCYKHLFCNHSELSRLGSHSVVSEQALRELYFRAFEIAFRVHVPEAVMTSYNALNGIYPGESAEILQGLVRGEWGFGGAIMSDWGSYRTVDAVEMVKAGNCWITPGGLRWAWRVFRAARRGEIPKATLQWNVKHLLAGMGLHRRK